MDQHERELLARRRGTGAALDLTQRGPNSGESAVEFLCRVDYQCAVVELDAYRTLLEPQKVAEPEGVRCPPVAAPEPKLWPPDRKPDEASPGLPWICTSSACASRHDGPAWRIDDSLRGYCAKHPPHGYTLRGAKPPQPAESVSDSQRELAEKSWRSIAWQDWGRAIIGDDHAGDEEIRRKIGERLETLRLVCEESKRNADTASLCSCDQCAAFRRALAAARRVME